MRAIILALAVLAFTVVNADAQTPNARVFNGGAGLDSLHDQARQHGGLRGGAEQDEGSAHEEREARPEAAGGFVARVQVGRRLPPMAT